MKVGYVKFVVALIFSMCAMQSMSQAANMTFTYARFENATRSTAAFGGVGYLGPNEHSPLVHNHYTISSNATQRNIRKNAFWAVTNYNNGVWQARASTVNRATSATAYVSLRYFILGTSLNISSSSPIR